MTDALSGLMVQGRRIDRELAATLLAPYLRIDRETGGIITLARWGEVRTEGRVLLWLLSRRVLWALGRLESPHAAPEQIAEGAGLPGGSVRPALQRLKAARVVDSPIKGIYAVPRRVFGGIAAYLPQGGGNA